MVMQTSCKKDMEQMDLLQAFEIIVDKAKNSSPDFVIVSPKILRQRV